MLVFFYYHLKVILHYIYFFSFFLSNLNLNYFIKQLPSMADNHELCNK